MNHQHARQTLRLNRVLALLAFGTFTATIALAGCASAVDTASEPDERPQVEHAIGAATFEPIIAEDPWLKGCCPQGTGWACPCIAIVVRPGSAKK